MLIAEVGVSPAPVIAMPAIFDAIAVTIGALSGAFHAERKRLDLWWDCRVKPLQVKSLGTEKIAPGEGVEKRELALLEFTHPDKDTTTIGIDPASFQPVYAAYRGPHPHTGSCRHRSPFARSCERARHHRIRSPCAELGKSGDAQPLSPSQVLHKTRPSVPTLPQSVTLAKYATGDRRGAASP